MKALRPTVLLGVPRLLERIYAAIRRKGEANWISNTLLRLFAWPWTVELGLLTPTQKVKRRALQQRFAQEIEALYAARRMPEPD